MKSNVAAPENKPDSRALESFVNALDEAHRVHLESRLVAALNQLFRKDIGNEVNGATEFFHIAQANGVAKDDCARVFRELCEPHAAEMRLDVEELITKANEWSYDYFTE